MLNPLTHVKKKKYKILWRICVKLHLLKTSQDLVVKQSKLNRSLHKLHFKIRKATHKKNIQSISNFGRHKYVHSLQNVCTVKVISLCAVWEKTGILMEITVYYKSDPFPKTKQNIIFTDITARVKVTLRSSLNTPSLVL